MTRTALAADDPDPPRFATGGIVTGAGYTLSTDGCVWPNGPRTVAYPAGNVSVTLDLAAARFEQQFMRDLGGSFQVEVNVITAAPREPYRTRAWVERPREIEAG